MENKDNSPGDSTLDCRGDGYEGLIGAVLCQRFRFITSLSKGSCGQVYKIEDIE